MKRVNPKSIKISDEIEKWPKRGVIVIFSIYDLFFLEISNGNIVKRSYSDTLRELRRKLNTTKET